MEFAYITFVLMADRYTPDNNRFNPEKRHYNQEKRRLSAEKRHYSQELRQDCPEKSELYPEREFTSDNSPERQISILMCDPQRRPKLKSRHSLENSPRRTSPQQTKRHSSYSVEHAMAPDILAAEESRVSFR